MAELMRSTDGMSPYRGYVVPVRWLAPVTKWDLMDDAGRADAERLTIRADGSVVRCTGCEAELVTEADYARHFVLPDLRYWNLGDCPHTGRSWMDAV